MTWEQLRRQVTIPFLLDLITQGTAWYVIHRVAGQPATAAPTITNPTDLQQLGRAAVHAVVVGNKRSQRDEAIFASLVNNDSITPLERSIIDDMLNLPVTLMMEDQKKNFRYIIALMQQLEGEDRAVQALKMVGNEPTPEDALAKVLAEGLLEPEDPTKVQKAVETFLTKTGVAVRAAWDHAEANVEQSGAHLGAKALFEGQLAKLFQK